LNYNKSFGNFQFDALAGYSYYDYTAAGREVTAKGFNKST
jgi:iron complex outermembrane receptor protein